MPSYPDLLVLGGAKQNEKLYNYKTIWNWNRNNWVLKKLLYNESRRFVIEQNTFFIGLIPFLSKNQKRVFYLGEYRLYCHLYKWRKLFGLNYSLVLFTGGQAIPGLFDKQKDFIHHITDVYLPDTAKLGYPLSRQFLIPHFVEFSFSVNKSDIDSIKASAKGKKIILSVGQIDATVKRMNLIPQLLEKWNREFYIILIGATTSETAIVEQTMKESGWVDFEIKKLPYREIGNYFAAADYFILCSPKESFGLVYLEAAVFDLPIITNDFQEARFVLKDKALFVDMNNIEKAKKIINEFFQKMPTVRTADWATNNYSWSALKSKYLDMFKSFSSN